MRLLRHDGGDEGAAQRTLRQAGIANYEVVYLRPDSHAIYYSWGCGIPRKLVFSIPAGRILGAPAVGLNGVEERIEVIAVAIQKQARVSDLEKSELRYAPR